MSQSDNLKDKSRRLFLVDGAKALTAAGIGVSLPENAYAGDRINEALVRHDGFSIMQGITTETSTQVTIDVPKKMHIRVALINSVTGQVHEPAVSDTTVVSFSDWRVDFYQFEELRLGHLYYLHVYDDRGRLLDERELTAVDLNRLDVRIGLVSCMFDFSLARFGLWSSLEKSAPDYLFFLGDNVYGDLNGLFKGPKLLWRRYIETRRRVPFYHFRRLIPSVSTWDDHDYGKNNAGGNYPHKESSVEIFNAFFPRRPVPGVFECGGTVNSCFDAFGHRFLFMDNRYYRDLKVGGKTNFWGAEQQAWAFERLNVNKPLWIAQGSQFFGGQYKKNECFERGYEDEFDETMRAVGRRNAPSLFLAGDVHFSEVMDIKDSRIPSGAYEITSSSMHSFPNILKQKNARRREAFFLENFILMDVLSVNYSTVYQVTSVARREKVKFSTQLVY